MTVRSASCPGCGATLDFRSAATVTVVCPHCGGGSYRTDVGLESFGMTAEVVDIATPLELGREGTFEGRRWTAVGFSQLDHGAGPWNEWVLAFDDGTFGWYAEAQGEIWFTTRASGVPVPPVAGLALEQELTLEEHGRFEVVERGEGVVVTFRGESPARIVPGERFAYADLTGADGRVGTLDARPASPSGEPTLYLGRRVSPSEFGLDAAAAPPTEVSATASRLSCPACGGMVDRLDPASVRIVCSSCGQLLHPDDARARALGVGAALDVRPALALGTFGELRGAKVQLIAFLVRAVTHQGRRYPWREYLLRTADGAYRWLVESEGHWSLVDPVSGSFGRAPSISFRGRALRHFQGGDARVDHVQGEVYWKVEVGDEVRVDDYVDPPYVLSVERTGSERVASFGSYVPVAEVTAAFRPTKPLREPAGAGACQPNPLRADRGRFWLVGGVLAVAMIVLMSVVSGAKGGDAVGFAFPGIPLLILLILPAVVVQTRSSLFEVRRWRDSDHPIGEED